MRNNACFRTQQHMQTPQGLHGQGHGCEAGRAHCSIWHAAPWIHPAPMHILGSWPHRHLGVGAGAADFLLGRLARGGRRDWCGSRGRCRGWLASKQAEHAAIAPACQDAFGLNRAACIQQQVWMCELKTRKQPSSAERLEPPPSASTSPRAETSTPQLPHRAASPVRITCK